MPVLRREIDLHGDPGRDLAHDLVEQRAILVERDRRKTDDGRVRPECVGDPNVGTRDRERASARRERRDGVAQVRDDERILEVGAESGEVEDPRSSRSTCASALAGSAVPSMNGSPGPMPRRRPLLRVQPK